MERAQQIRQIPRLGKLGCRCQQNVCKSALLSIVAFTLICQGVLLHYDSGTARLFRKILSIMLVCSSC
jgi:hypothetical protein